MYSNALNDNMEKVHMQSLLLEKAMLSELLQK